MKMKGLTVNTRVARCLHFVYIVVVVLDSLSVNVLVHFGRHALVDFAPIQMLVGRCLHTFQTTGSRPEGRGGGAYS